eukprot:SAG31_NODE_597_length_13674_cov_3.402947_4_plen_65_part_00
MIINLNSTRYLLYQVLNLTRTCKCKFTCTAVLPSAYRYGRTGTAVYTRVAVPARPLTKFSTYMY